MRRFLTSFASVLFTCLILSGCGGHEGGVIAVSPDQNPYQVSEQQQKAIHAATDETLGIPEETEDADSNAESGDQGNADASPEAKQGDADVRYPTQPTYAPRDQ